MTTNLLNFKRDFLSKIPVIAPDPTFYKQIKKISLELLPVKEIPECDIPLPLSFRYLDDFFVNLWKRHHGARLFTICKNSKRSTTSPPYRSIFPGPYIPFLDGKMKVIGDSAFSVFLNTIITVKQRIPDINKLHQNENGYIYENTYYPIIKKINEPEEGWNIKFFECPVIDGVYFPIAGSLKYTKKDLNQLDRIIKLIANECQSLYQKYFQNDKFTKKDIRKIISLIRCVQYLYTPHIRDSEVEIFKEILTLFKHRNRLEKPAELLFEIDHVVSYFHKLRNKEILLSGAYGMAWLDVIRLPVESLVETELCDIERVLREIRSFFSIGWAPILVHLSGEYAYNIDGTHRHYALLAIELLRRLINTFCKPIRLIDINSKKASYVIQEFSWRYKKVGLSLRETLRVVNYIINSDPPWSYINFLESELKKIQHIEFQYIPVIYLPEWRARTVVKNLFDKGVGLVGIPPINIEIVGSSNGKKGIFIRGGYHGDDRQPSPWFNIIALQKSI